jgi:exopolyphosphatase/pppGpp-phosphohydrolase
MMDVGVIDVGSHTVRLLLARRADGRIQPLRHEKAALGLGAEVERLGRLSEEKIAEAASLVGRSPASPERPAQHTSRPW